jgi:CheY-like chemotaxis protein
LERFLHYKTAMKEVLIVDDFKPTLKSIKAYLSSEHKGKLKVHIAENGKEAKGILNSSEIDLVVTDIGMPIMDGLELLAYMSKDHPGIPVIVMTSFGDPQIEERLKKFSAFLYLEKPFDIKELEGKILEVLNAETEGHIRGFSLPSFLQLIEMESKTCTLEIEFEGNKGFLYFSEGDLSGAKTKKKTGIDAALEILSLEKAEIDILSKCRKTEKTITAPLHYILLESAQIKDEKNKEKSEKSSLESLIEQEIEKEMYSLLDFNNIGTNPEELGTNEIYS